MVKIVWTETALEDLRNIHDYISKDSILYANRLGNKFLRKIEILHTFPKVGRIVSEFEKENIRELIEGNYRIVYYISSRNSISILRIHHSSRLMLFL